MLSKDKPTVTPHDEKFQRYLDIKAHAITLVPLLLPGAVNSMRSIEAGDSMNSRKKEEFRKGLFGSMAGNALLIAESFDGAIEEVKLEIKTPKKLERVVAFAKKVVPVLIPSSLQALRNLNEKHPPATEEAARAAKVKEFDELCEIAMLVSQAFEEETQKAKGKFIHDDA